MFSTLVAEQGASKDSPEPRKGSRPVSPITMRNGSPNATPVRSTTPRKTTTPIRCRSPGLVTSNTTPVRSTTPRKTTTPIRCRSPGLVTGNTVPVRSTTPVRCGSPGLVARGQGQEACVGHSPSIPVPGGSFTFSQKAATSAQAMREVQVDNVDLDGICQRHTSRVHDAWDIMARKLREELRTKDMRIPRAEVEQGFARAYAERSTREVDSIIEAERAKSHEMLISRHLVEREVSRLRAQKASADVQLRMLEEQDADSMREKHELCTEVVALRQENDGLLDKLMSVEVDVRKATDEVDVQKTEIARFAAMQTSFAKQRSVEFTAHSQRKSALEDESSRLKCDLEQAQRAGLLNVQSVQGKWEEEIKAMRLRIEQLQESASARAKDIERETARVDSLQAEQELMAAKELALVQEPTARLEKSLEDLMACKNREDQLISLVRDLQNKILGSA